MDVLGHLQVAMVSSGKNGDPLTTMGNTLSHFLNGACQPTTRRTGDHRLPFPMHLTSKTYQ